MVTLKFVAVGQQVPQHLRHAHVRLPVLHAVVLLALGRYDTDEIALVRVDLKNESHKIK